MDEKQQNKIFKLTETSLGKGSFGHVYMGRDETNKKIAIKCCSLEQNGIPNLLEASLMKSLLHPYLNHAIQILCTDEQLLIMQELAVMDLHTYTHNSKMNHQWTKLELIQVYHSLLQAVYVLHQQQLIHGDIKSNNILIYPQGQVKLTDFTLTTKKINTLTHTVCTPTHRPLECHLQDPWDETLDLWSLGCTFYEMSYNCYLFKKQKHVHQYINAILDWGQKQNQALSMSFYHVYYHPIILCQKWFNDPFELNQIIQSLLQINPVHRIHSNILLQHPLFKNLTCYNPELVQPLSKLCSISEQARVMRYIEQCTNHPEVQKKAYELYCFIHTDMSEIEKAVGVSWIASKLLLETTVMINKIIPLEQILKIEKDICHALQFMLSY